MTFMVTEVTAHNHQHTNITAVKVVVLMTIGTEKFVVNYNAQ